MNEKPYFVRHPHDCGIDEVLFVSEPAKTTKQARKHAFLRLAIIERYKTSEMSGDEWRFSSGLYMRKQESWELLSTGGIIESHCAQLYPELYGDLASGKMPKELAARMVASVAFSWKGHPVYSASHDGKPVPLLVAAGHLPWAWLLAGDNGSDPEPLNRLCCQPGCATPHVSIYRLKRQYCREAHPSDPPFMMVRGFCAKHLRRGDCAFDDSDSNYEVMSGPGPDGHEPAASVVSVSRTVFESREKP